MIFILRIILLLWCSVTWASPPHQFEHAEDLIRYQNLVKNFRCVTCQNQNLAESNAPIAEAMRDEIAIQLKAKRTDLEIENFLVARYGDFVLYRPPLKPHTIALWFAPLVIVLIALGSMIWIIVFKKEIKHVGQ